MNGTVLLFPYTAESVCRSHHRGPNLHRQQRASNRTVTAAHRVFFLTEQMLSKNNACTLYIIAQTVLKDVSAHQTTVVYLRMGTIMALSIHINFCGAKHHFAHTTSLHYQKVTLAFRHFSCRWLRLRSFLTKNPPRYFTSSAYLTAYPPPSSPAGF